MTGSAAHLVGRRAARNSSARAVGEIVAKLASLALLVAIARELGQAELGALVFAVAYLDVVVAPIGLGMDPYLLRQVARDRRHADRLFFDMLALKATWATPVLAVAFGVLFVIEDDPHVRLTVAVLAAGILLDLISRTFDALFTAHERSDLLALTLVAHRVFTAIVGIAALAAGGDIVVVAGIYSLGSLLHLLLGFAVLRRYVGIPRRRFRPRGWRRLAGRSAGFAVQDVVNVLLFKLDAVILAVLGTQAAVGRYGAAYRLLESMTFVSWALASGFAAMYSYLGPNTTPTVQAVFAGSIKLALALLMPVAIAMAVFAEPIITLVYGEGFRAAADTLRLLAPVIVLLCLVLLGTVLITSQRAPGAAVPLTLGALALNVALNAVLIPIWDERGAAAAMLITEALLAVGVLVLAQRSMGAKIRWPAVLMAPLLAGCVMGVVSMSLAGSPVLLGLAAGAAAYAVSLFALERRFNPADLAFARQLLRRPTRDEPPA